LKKIFILGASGSIGENALSVIDSNKENFELVGISVNSNVEKANKIIKKHNPKYIYINDKSAIENILKTEDTVICEDEKELSDIFNSSDVDIVISAISGFAGIKSTFHAAKSGKKILLANKESIVAGGSLLMETVRENNTELVPIDSEHNAIFQCLPESRSTQDVKQIVITASGGPFHGRNIDELNNVGVQDALNHPNWEMGSKISIDSATLVNKCLELIEACYLFDMDESFFELVIHPESIVHSIVTFNDGSSICQMSNPDMRVPIANAMSDDNRLSIPFQPIDFNNLKLNFESFPNDRAEIVNLAREAVREDSSKGIYFNAANEIAVENFLKKRITFRQIYEVILRTFDTKEMSKFNSIEDIFEIDQEARNISNMVIKSLT
jgi:1-deoxy-D-xylulose-5-phosphate reductoisomerase|tara:strand:- start:2274 stop:3422 length:1149 start_codon:yes stop_codon:yes gene_type:complete